MLLPPDLLPHDGVKLTDLLLLFEDAEEAETKTQKATTITKQPASFILFKKSIFLCTFGKIYTPIFSFFRKRVVNRDFRAETCLK